ncbi:MAG: transcription elongation factor GreA [Bacilli bacterium]
MQEKIKITQTGYDELSKELRQLLDVEQPNVRAQLAEARSQGDLSENADYDAARDRQAEIEGRINQIEAILYNCEIITLGKKIDKVSLGSTVEIEITGAGANDGIRMYQIVGPVEADLKKNKISNVCPLGIAIIGKKIGDTVEIKTAKPYNVKIVSISA